MGRVFQHEIGKRHLLNLSKHNKRSADKQQRDEEKVYEEPEPISIAPGEPAPPGFEDEINRVAQIQVGLLKSFLSKLCRASK